MLPQVANAVAVSESDVNVMTPDDTAVYCFVHPATATAVVSRACAEILGRFVMLPDAVRGFMEPRFKADFSAVRVHNDSHAHDWAPAVNARAFIVGRYVYAANQIDRTAGARVHVHRLAGQ